MILWDASGLLRVKWFTIILDPERMVIEKYSGYTALVKIFSYIFITDELI